MSDLKILEEKINHVDKIVASIDTTVKHFAEKLAETVQQNSMALDNHDNRITGLERSFHVYDGSIKTLNRILSIVGSSVIAGVIWLFVQVHDYKREYAIMQGNVQLLSKDVERLTSDLERMKYEKDKSDENK